MTIAKEQRGNGHESQAAHLDKQNDDRLSENGPVGARVLGHKARDAGGGGGGEERVQKGCAAGIQAGDGQHQQPRSQQDHDEKAQGDDLHTGQLRFSSSFHRHTDPVAGPFRRGAGPPDALSIPHFFRLRNRPAAEE